MTRRGTDEEAAEAEAEGEPLPLAATPPPPASNSSANTTTISPGTAAAAGVENHPSPDSAPVPIDQTAAALEMEEKCNKKGVEDAPVPVEMMDTSYDRAEKGSLGAHHQHHLLYAKLGANKASSGPGAQLARPDDENGPYNERTCFSERLRRKLASAPRLQPRASTGSSSSGDDVEDAMGTLTVRPPLPSMLPTPEPDEPSVPAFHEVHASLVEDEIYVDAVPVGEEHWAKRHQKKIVGGFVLVIIAMAVAFGVTFGIGAGGGDSGDGSYMSGSFISTPSRSPSMMPSMYPSHDLAPTLQQVQERGKVRCGLSSGRGLAGEGFYTNLCRAVAAVLLGDPNSIEEVPVSGADRFQSLHTRSIDLSLYGDTHTIEREVREQTTGAGFSFSNPIYYDGIAYAGYATYVE